MIAGVHTVTNQEETLESPRFVEGTRYYRTREATDLVTPQFNSIFPATCPYVTAVGGTSDVMPETAWNASSGGFSNY
ncbi:hypothetical protein N7494_006397 [Penicillium frequentans]|uniref:Uncharacterized protein n=1 Tax=Penicillium frequentans TaxID=3151616 RepID=A0AAD6GGJ2_9EURO|nr:hypothetical protein N7494_006397 [Penicillium glabrum]